jgi:bifunctional UDP-N-acetylglucosamine pyrophosphorylase/glucosamine-1-phosphate N-acetyltransferase
VRRVDRALASPVMASTTNPLAAVVLAAGKGTRMKSSRAKVLHELCGRPLGSYPVRRALEIGASPVAVVVGHQAEAVEAALAAALPDAPLRFAAQREQLGTAHAVLSARGVLAEHRGPILILSGDTPLLRAETLRAVVDARAAAGAPLAFATMELDAPHGYGRVLRDGRGKPLRVVEEQDATDPDRAVREVNAGVYCVDSAFLWEALAQVGSHNAQREFYLTDLVALAGRGAGAVAVPVPSLDAEGVNDRAQLARAGRELVRRTAARLMRDGVTIEDPARFDCDEDVVVGPDTVIEANVVLRRGTRIGSGCRIGHGAVLSAATLGDDVTVNPYTVVDQAIVARRAVLGPFTRLRPGADVGEEVHLGNFVEVKKSRLGKGVKANHLTYLGDAVVGAGTNVGCGTITCNYDGEKKHETRIGERAFIGSDSILVAPIEIGDGAYVAAGSTITKPVPPGALALGRAQQVTKEGWVAARKAKAHKKE